MACSRVDFTFTFNFDSVSQDSFLRRMSYPSIQIINMVGVPWAGGGGARCSNMWLVFMIHPNSMNRTSSGRASVSVSVRCLVLVKMYGNNRRKLSRLYGILRLEYMSFLYFLSLLLELILFLGVVCFISWLTIMLFGDGINQIIVGINKYSDGCSCSV